ncbi:MAG TPA: hypothetical protein VH701_00930 [Vicinamibacterales bacterium]
MRLVTSVMALGAAAAWPLPPATGQWRPPFVDRTAQLGIEFVHVNGATGALLLPEVIGPGGALFDYDNDGDLDLFFVQGTAFFQEQVHCPLF